MSLKANNSVASRIKKMMQSDEDVGKVAKAAPVLIAAALDSFLDNLVGGAGALAQERGAKLLTSSHIKAKIMGDSLLDFCKEIVSNIPDLPEPGSEDQNTAKRSRPKSATTSGGIGGEAKPKRARNSKKEVAETTVDDELQVDTDTDIVDGGEEQQQQQQQQPVINETAQVAPPAQQQQGQQGNDETNDEAAAAVAGIPTFMVAGTDIGAEAEEEDYDA